jgi:hypothetical protein
VRFPSPAPLLRLLPVWLLIFGLTLTGCCVNERCECRDQHADSIYLRFSTDTATAASPGFRAAEKQVFYLIRTPIDTLDRPRQEEIELSAKARPDADYDLVISATAPFASNPRKPSGYSYRIVNSARRPYEVRLTDVKLGGRYATVNECCTCYENLRKSLRVNDGPVLDLYDPTGNQPVIVELRKR